MSRRWRSGGLLAVAALMVSCGLGAERREATSTSTSSGPAVCSGASLARLRLAGAAVTDAEPISAGRFQAPDADTAEDRLPPFCRVTGTATPSADSLIHFELWLPEGRAWNGKLVVTGNGSYSPDLAYGDMAYALRQGYAALGGDTGHGAAESSSLRWGAGHPEKIIDWGRRSVHAITEPGREISAALGGRPVARSYFYGCSTGGHQAYAEVQLYPQDFDGVIAGAPANNWVALSTEFLWRFRANRSPESGHALILSPEKAAWLERKSVEACDALDGSRDGVIADPRACRAAGLADPERLQCRGGAVDNCLTPAEVAAARRLYQGATDPQTGAALYPGSLPGTESGWVPYWRENAPTRHGFWGLWVAGDPQWDPWRFDFHRDPALARERLGAVVDQVDPDIGAFKARGGKLITYQGFADPVINALDTIAYHDRVRERQGSLAATDEFFRLFVVPGMGHCGGGPGGNVFGNAGQAAPQPSADNDLLSALDRWVERGVAPSRLTAYELDGAAVRSTRALCPYPRQAVYRGHGPRGEAASFECR